jgi:HK97 family phage prohead protease
MSHKPDGAEKRSLVRPVEHRADANGKMTVAGYAAVFGEVADIGGWFKEVVARGAFTNTLKTADVRAYFDHDTGRVLGRLSSGTLRCEEDDKGLRIEIDLPDTTDGRDVKALVERGDVSGKSFRFEAVRQEWDETVDPPKRTLLEVNLGEVSIVSEPAYDGTSVALRSLDAIRKEARRQHNAAAFARRKAESEAKFRKIS